MIQATQLILDSPTTLLKRKSIETSQTDSRATASAPNDLKSRLVVGFFRTLTKNVSHLRRSATFHSNNNTNNKTVNNNNNDQPSTTDPNLSKYVGFMDDKKHHNDQHHINLPDNSQKKADSISNASSNLTRQTCETTLTSTSVTIAKNKNQLVERILIWDQRFKNQHKANRKKPKMKRVFKKQQQQQRLV